MTAELVNPIDTPVIVDALPYIDSEYEEPGVKEMVLAMIEEEKRRYRPTKNYLEHLPPLELHKFETEVMKKEFERCNHRTPMEVLSMKRYELPPPPTGKLTDLSAWNECVDNSYAQLEHQNTRICNLDLMLEYSCESWKSYLEVFVKMVTQSQKQLAELKKQIQEINWERKTTQNNAGEKLKQLESSWVGLVSKNYEIERACIELEKLHAEYKTEIARKEAMSVDYKPPTPPPTYDQYYDSSIKDQSQQQQPDKSSDSTNKSQETTETESMDVDDESDVVGPQPINYEHVPDPDEYAGDDSDKYAAQAEVDDAEENSDDDEESD